MCLKLNKYDCLLCLLAFRSNQPFKKEFTTIVMIILNCSDLRIKWV